MAPRRSALETGYQGVEATTDEEEIIRINPKDAHLVRALVSTYFHQSPEERSHHCDPVVYAGTMHALNLILHHPNLNMFQAEVQMALGSRFHLDPVSQRAAVAQARSTLKSIRQCSVPKAKPA